MAQQPAEKPATRLEPAPSPEPDDASQPVFKDVWTRSGTTYRFRAIALYLLDVVLFACVASFAYWLRTGERFAPAHAGYADELRQAFWSVGIMGKGGVSLGSLLIEPINVQNVPMQIPILGLLMAALISVPILVAILYRFWSSVPFIAVVALLAVMPWLAVTLLVSCILASVRPFRTPFRFMSALLGLWPAAIYFTLAWLGTTDTVAGRIDPVDRIKFVAPWVLAIVAASVAFAMVLMLAKLVDYRPGAIAPTLAVMLVVPVLLFEFHVGRDELYYRLLESRHASHFGDIDASIELDEAVARAWADQRSTGRPWQEVRETTETRWLFGITSDLSADRSALAEHQSELSRECDEFLRNFPHSPYAPNVLYIKARALDMRVDTEEFRRTRWIRFYDEFPTTASQQTWRILAESKTKGALLATALLRLAQLEAREGDVERAIGKLATVRANFDTADEDDGAAPARAGAFRTLLTRDSPDASLGVPQERIVLEAHRLYELLTSNRDPTYGDDPIGGPRGASDGLWFGMMDLDPRHERYGQNLEALLAQYPNCQLEDNLELERAKAAAPATARIEKLHRCIDRFRDRDAAPEALFRLGIAYHEAQDWQECDEAFATLLREHPHSIWARQSVRYRLRPPPARLSEAR